MRRWNKGTRRSISTSTSSKTRTSQAAPSPSRPKPSDLPPPTASEAAFEAALAALIAGKSASAAATPDRDCDGDRDRDDFVDRAFAASAGYLRDRFATIGDAPAFYTKIVGVSFEGRQDVVAGLRSGAALELQRRPDNPFDPNAIEVRYGALQIGFIRRQIAVHVAPALDAGITYRARIASLTGGGERSRGVNVYVERDAAAGIGVRDRSRGSLRSSWSGDADRIRAALIGTSQPHAAQREVLERVAAGRNTLAVLGTGRGKSFCFQLPAALRALSDGGKTLVVYPLRALVNDQYEALMRTLDPLGLRIYRANGAIEAAERADLFAALSQGAWDVVLATPEFLAFHRDAFAGTGRPSLLVVDEAHHVHESRHRPAYASFAQTRAALGNPQVLALTATAGDDAFEKIVAELGIEAWVIDPTVRENLKVADARNCRDKGAYLRELFAGGDKGIVYCNSRRDATEVARGLRGAIGNEVMYYHAGMPTTQRHEVERLFREGGLRVVVATSAFGEGIDLPDVRHVALYHLNFDFAEFNQQAGRAGRDGIEAKIHLLYGDRDRRVNDYLIDLDAPRLPALREIYRGMRHLARDGVLRKSNADLAELLGVDNVRDRTIAAALRIFSDSRLIDVSEDDEGRAISFLPVSGKVEMESNERYAEGLAIRDAFERFCTLALEAPAETLERIVNRPIYPSDVPLRR